MKDFLTSITILLIYLAIAVAALAFSAWLFKLIWNSELPVWLKYFLLK